jgi:hypothetical protein
VCADCAKRYVRWSTGCTSSPHRQRHAICHVIAVVVIDARDGDCECERAGYVGSLCECAQEARSREGTWEGGGGDDEIDAKQDFELKSKLGIGAHGTRHTHMMSALTCALGVVYHAVHIPSRAEVALKSVFGGSDADVEQVGDMLGSRVC